MRCTFNRQSLRASALALLAFSVAGCGGSGGVTGQVTLNGVPLSGGWVTLNYAGGKPAPVSGAIGTDGSYRISGCPTGEVRVTVRQPQNRGRTPKQPAIPARYADPEKTDIKTTLGNGTQRLDLDLKP